MPEMAERDPTFSTDEAEQPIPGRRLEETIRTAMAQVRGMNWSRLARESGVSRGTMYRWFAGEQQPSSWTLGRIAKTLDVPVGDLWAAWEQRPTVAPSTEIAILRLIERLDRQDEVLNELVAELKALADGSIASTVTEALAASRRNERLAPSLARATRRPRHPADLFEEGRRQLDEVDTPSPPRPPSET